MMRSPRPKHHSIAASIGAICIALLGFGCFAVSLPLTQPVAAQSTTEPNAGGPTAQPKRHFRVERPADLSNADALTVYTQVLEEMAGGYRLSGLPAAGDYRRWQRYNTVPYRSATHGERFVSNYANTLGRDYGKFEDFGALPTGAILAKDSFAVTASGDVFAGPLFLMEKMPAGFDRPGRDWRYSMIMPDGSVFGTTKGQGDEKVAFCVTCHQAAGDENDHLFFIPETFRRKVLRVQPASQ